MLVYSTWSATLKIAVLLFQTTSICQDFCGKPCEKQSNNICKEKSVLIIQSIKTFAKKGTQLIQANDTMRKYRLGKNSLIIGKWLAWENPET